jgi:hypothetical protein
MPQCPWLRAPVVRHAQDGKLRLASRQRPAKTVRWISHCRHSLHGGQLAPRLPSWTRATGVIANNLIASVSLRSVVRLARQRRRRFPRSYITPWKLMRSRGHGDFHSPSNAQSPDSYSHIFTPPGQDDYPPGRRPPHHGREGHARPSTTLQ